MSDFDDALNLYAQIAAGGDDEQLRFCVIPGNPWSKRRPRFARGRTYQKRDDLEAEQRTALHLSRLIAEKFTGNVALGCIFYRSNRQRIDADNLLKHVCDSATGVLWVDDCQVTAIFGRVEFDSDNPRTVVVIGRDASTMQRGSDALATCQQCGREFNIAGQPLRPYCTNRCARTALSGVDLTAELPCAGCGQPFRRLTTSQRYCSKTCFHDVNRGTPRPLMQKDRSCVTCGAQRKRANSKQCRACWLAKAGAA
jgi:Holliday junction resolvase RusA-like endonuclease/endogenous inhibitor of DNA gyrase (YacG/DUF329 family)